VATLETLEVLARQAGRWSVASRQDQEPLVRLLHANYAMGYVLALRQVASDQEIFAKLGLNAHALEAEIASIQDAATMAAVTAAPGLAPPNGMARLAREGR
jgi:hypothetical protein